MLRKIVGEISVDANSPANPVDLSQLDAPAAKYASGGVYLAFTGTRPRDVTLVENSDNTIGIPIPGGSPRLVGPLPPRFTDQESDYFHLYASSTTSCDIRVLIGDPSAAFAIRPLGGAVGTGGGGGRTLPDYIHASGSLDTGGSETDVELTDDGGTKITESISTGGGGSEELLDVRSIGRLTVTGDSGGSGDTIFNVYGREHVDADEETLTNRTILSGVQSTVMRGLDVGTWAYVRITANGVGGDTETVYVHGTPGDEDRGELHHKTGSISTATSWEDILRFNTYDDQGIITRARIHVANTDSDPAELRLLQATDMEPGVFYPTALSDATGDSNWEVVRSAVGPDELGGNAEWILDLGREDGLYAPYLLLQGKQGSTSTAVTLQGHATVERTHR